MTQILEILQGALIAVIIAGIGLAKSTVMVYLKEKSQMIKDSNQRQLAEDSLYKASLIVETVVSSVQQSLVENFKTASKDGKLTKDEIAFIQHTTNENINKLIDDDLRASLDSLVGNAELFIENLIESKVLKLKRSYELSKIEHMKQAAQVDLTNSVLEEAAIV